MLGLIVVASLMSALGVWFTASLADGGPACPPSTALVLRLGRRPRRDRRAPGCSTSSSRGPPTVRALVDALGRAKTDRRVKGLVVEPAGGSPFWAKSQEVRDAILDFRTSGKKTIAFLEFGGEQEYFLATACDAVVLLPTSVLDLKGLATYEVFLRGTFDKIGVDARLHPHRRLQDGDQHLHREDVHAGAPRDDAVAEPRHLRSAGAGDRRWPARRRPRRSER